MEEDSKEKVIKALGGKLDQSAKSNTFYVTTPIYYINDRPHIGHAYTTIVGDVIARWYRQIGYKVYYVTGTDENSQKNVEAAKAAGNEDVNDYLNEMSSIWKGTWEKLGITNDDFIRTTEDRHKRGVELFWNTVKENGDIYKGEYEGWYCVGCEAFYVESDLEEGNICPNHKKPAEHIKEENYFFKLTKYRDALLEYIKLHPEFVQPGSRQKEITNYIKDHMEDISISRQRGVAGINVPDDPDHKIYVWFDALINYLTAVGYGTDMQKYETWWPASLHLVGKDIIKFHCALWPAMLLSAGLPLPRKVFANGYFTFEGQKMSKSIGNVVDPVSLSEEMGIDPLRYFLLREITFGSDGDFSQDRLNDRYQSDLANELGNLVHRVLSMTEKYCKGKVPQIPIAHKEIPWDEYGKCMERLAFGEVLDHIWEVIRSANKFIEDQKPWELDKDSPERVPEILGHLLETLRQIGWLILPILPNTAHKIFIQLGLDPEKETSQDFDQAKKWGELKQGTKIKKGEPLFPRLD